MNWEHRANAVVVLGGLLLTGWCIGRAQVQPHVGNRGLPESNEFVPVDIRRAYFGACGFYAVLDAPSQGHAETKIWVRWARPGEKTSGRDAEFSPIMSHREDILSAIDDCVHWYADVRKEIAKGEIKGDPVPRHRDLGIPARLLPPKGELQ